MTELFPLCDCITTCSAGCGGAFIDLCRGTSPRVPLELRAIESERIRRRCGAAPQLPRLTATPELSHSEAELERAAADRSRCRHRGVTPIDHQPCACRTIAQLPIYHCAAYDCACADLRTPTPPVRHCAECVDYEAICLSQ